MTLALPEQCRALVRTGELPSCFPKLSVLDLLDVRTLRTVLQRTTVGSIDKYISRQHQLSAEGHCHKLFRQWALPAESKTFKMTDIVYEESLHKRSKVVSTVERGF